MSEGLANSGVILSFYGDDFTGSTDALEVLGTNGLSPVLFLDPPSAQQMSRFPQCRAVGVAGVARSQSPAWMSAELPPIFTSLKHLGSQICHYKVCSTFDSSPETGSIGRALEIGQQVFDVPFVPIVVGAPSLRRYTLFGNLFAGYGGGIYRLDRHPAMMAHPVTPMTESDLRLHLARQTGKKIGLLDIVALQQPLPEEKLKEVLAENPDAVLFDILDQASLIEVGRMLWNCRPASGSFIVGSSGVEYALMAYWRASGQLVGLPQFDPVTAVDRLVVVSGSCSPNTERQIRRALGQGFAGIPVDAGALAAGEEATRQALMESALRELAQGRSLVVYTALGREDSSRAKAARERESSFGMRLSAQLGVLLRELIRRTGIRRVLIAGGDTSSYVGRQLGLEALTMASPMILGAPLCRAHVEDPSLDGLEIVFKGGQMGSDECFARVRNGQMG